MSSPLQRLADLSFGTNFPYEGDFRVDDNVLGQFPPGTKVLSARRYATSAWTVTARLRLALPDGLEASKQLGLFLKSAPLARGAQMMRGEFHAMAAFYEVAPDFVPKPHAWGRYALDGELEAYFLLLEFVDFEMTTTDQQEAAMPDPVRLCSQLARVHRKSQSPTGQFGFPVTTCQNLYPQSVGWDGNWTRFYAVLVKHVMATDFQVNGHWEELDKVEQRVVARVVPRLLDALVQDGRTIKPSLIHADLWEGNTGTSSKNGNVYTYDPAAFYAHNELDVSDWRGYYNKINQDVYIKTYLDFFPASEPTEDWEDRNRLYACYFYLWYSVHHKESGKAVRQMAYNDMLSLVEKFAPFPEGEDLRKIEKSEMATLSAERDHTA